MDDKELRQRLEELYAATPDGPEKRELLKTLGRLRVQFPIEGESLILETHVVTGKALESLIQNIRPYKHRHCYGELRAFLLNEEDYTHVCALYGLRRTGKTVLALQALQEVANAELSNVAFIRLDENNDMDQVYRDLKKLRQLGIKYVCLDEVTSMCDFIDTAATLSDDIAPFKMKLILSGTDSYGIYLARRRELFGRVHFIHTTYIPYKEYTYLLGDHSIDTYIEAGGVLDPAVLQEDTSGYITTSVVDNIVNSFRRTRNGVIYNKLHSVCNTDELHNLINRLVEDMGKQFTLEVIQRVFKSGDLGIARRNLGKESSLRRIDEEGVTRGLKEALGIKEYNELEVRIQECHLQQLKAYLQELEMLTECQVRVVGGRSETLTLYTQPGLRYSQVKSLISALDSDYVFSSASDRDMVTQRILEEVRGRMLEDIVLYETKRSLGDTHEVFKYKFGDNEGEFDMVVYDREQRVCRVYEVKHSSKQVPAQAKHLLEEVKVRLVEERYAPVEERCVLYLGDTDLSQPIHYRNVEEYLKELPN